MASATSSESDSATYHISSWIESRNRFFDPLAHALGGFPPLGHVGVYLKPCSDPVVSRPTSSMGISFSNSAVAAKGLARFLACCVPLSALSLGEEDAERGLRIP
ncbi:unnamed protein product [Linum trigynum]|uniref:Uncharacterized protein n=1 Tax=Linum trigynum TaxID=586398 RepID=A0AAV2FUJ9_9ROSI